MARIKITGYINTSELDESEVLEMHPTGLTESGYTNLISGENGDPLSVADLHDVEVTYLRD
jgi:hypothetical protein